MSAFVNERRSDFGVEPICKTLEVSASACYERASGRRSARELSDERVLEKIREVHKANYEAYGYQRTWKAMKRAGSEVARCTVARLMRVNGIRGAKRRGKPWRTTKADLEAGQACDLVERDFTAQAPNRLWVCDFTYLRSWEGIVFLSFVIDVFSRKVVGWQLATHMRTDLVLDALRMALGMREPGADVALVHHSDRGSQYTSIDYTQTLDDHSLLRSLGSTGDAYDNALAESFVDSLKTELIADRVWRSRDGLELAVVEYLGWFNNDRLHSSLGDIPPVEFEALHAAALAGATTEADSPNGSPAAPTFKPSDRCRSPRSEDDPAQSGQIAADRGDRARPASLRPTASASRGGDQPTTLMLNEEEPT